MGTFRKILLYDHLTAEELIEYFAGSSAIRRPSVGGAPRRSSTRLGSQPNAGAVAQVLQGMLQRVGVAQALINDPEVLFSTSRCRVSIRSDDERFATDPAASWIAAAPVFFSSHVLSDAEALCNRVAIVAAGNWWPEGQLSELLALRVRGWELVVSGVSREVLDRRGGDIVKVTPLGGNRYTLELPLSPPPPQQVLSDLVAQGASLVSLNPIRDTLEDLFVQQVARADADRGLSPAGSRIPDPGSRKQ